MKRILYFQEQRFAQWRTVVFFSAFLLVLASCRKDDKLIGREVQPEGELLPLETIDSFTVKAFTIAPTSLRTDETVALLGQTSTAAMGVTRSAINLNFQLQSENVSWTGGLPYKIDSVVLHLRPLTAGTDFPVSLPVSVRRLSAPQSRADEYFSDSKVLLESSPVGKAVLTLNEELDGDDTTLVDIGDTLVTQFFRHRIRLDDVLGEQLLFGLGTEYTISDDFINYFPGLQIAVDSSISGTDHLGVLLYALTTGESGIRLYATANDTTRLALFFPATTSTARYNTFRHNYTGSGVAQALNDATDDDSEIYVQGMAGVRSQIEFPYLNDFARETDAAVSKATLTFKVSDNQPVEFDPAVRLFLVNTDSAGDEYFTLDYAFSTGRYGGVYDEDSKSYEFDVTRQIQAIIEAAQEGRDINNGFRLIREIYSISTSSNIASETVLLGSDDIVLKLHMTNLNP